MIRINRKKYLFVIVFLMMVIVVLSAGVTFARYVGNEVWDYYLESNDFYFASEHLDGSENLNNSWNGETTYFNIQNFENLEKISEDNIEYELSCEVLDDPNLTCQLNGTSYNTYSSVIARKIICVNDTLDEVDVTTFDESTCLSRGYTWQDGNTVATNYFNVTSSDTSYEYDEVKVRVTAESKLPFSKVLYGDFVLIKDDMVLSEVEVLSNDTYETLVITNNSELDKNYVLRWNSTQINISQSDYLDHKLDTSNNITEIEFFLGANETINYNFYKVSSDIIIDENSFILSEKTEDDSIKVSTVTSGSISGVYVYNKPVFTNRKIIFDTRIYTSSSFINYNVVITNNTSDNYLLADVISSFSNSNYNYTLSNIAINDVINAGDSVTATIKLTASGSSQIGISTFEFIFDRVIP